MKTTHIFLALLAVTGTCAPVWGGMPDVAEIVLLGEYAGHLQDVWWDGGENIYWAHTWDIVKTDLSGNILRHVEVEGHNAGCQLKDGKLYVAVCPTANKSIVAWGPDSRLQVNEYDADTLALVATHVMPANDRAGSLAVLEDGSFIVGCLRPGDITASQVRFHHVSADFTILSTHLIDGLKIEMGIETIKRYGNSLYLMCYGAPTVRLDASTFGETGRMSGYDGTRGFVYDGQHFWQGVSTSSSGAWHSKLVRLNRSASELAFFEPSAAGAGRSAPTYAWTGGAGDYLFSTAGNWQGGVAPTAATSSDTLAFSVGGVASNDIAGLTVGNVDVMLVSGTELTLAGWRLGGNGTLTKTGGGSLVFNATNMPNANYSQAIAVNEGFLKIPISGDFYGALTVAEGACMLCSSGTVNFRGPVEISGVSTNTGAQIHYYTRVKGNPTGANAGNTTWFRGGLDGVVTLLGGNSKSGQAVFYANTSCFHGYFRTNGRLEIDGRTGELFRKTNNIFAGAPSSLTVIGGITVNGQNNFGTYSDSLNRIVLITNSTINVTGALAAGRVGPNGSGNKSTMRLGDGTTATAADLFTGHNAWPNYGAIEILKGATVNVTNRVCAGFHDGQVTIPKCYGTTNANEWITVDGGTLNADGIGIGIGFRGPQSRFYLKSGTVNAKGFYFQALRAKGAGVSGGGIGIGGTNTYRFVMTGGTMNIGAWGFESRGREDNSEANVILSGGTLNAMENFAIPYHNPTLFGTWRGGSPGGFTLNTAGRTVTLNTALNGLGDVRLTGNGTVAGTNAMQGALGGKWTVDGGMTADLRGAASLLGGLAVGANASVALDVGAGRSAAFFSRDGSWPLGGTSPTILNRFNGSDGGSVSSLISHDMWLLNVSSGTKPNYMGNSRETFISKGEFYVAPEEAGTWTFSGIYSDNIQIRIDDQIAMSPSASKYANLQVALSAGWHRFVIICVAGGGFGPGNRVGLAVGFAKSAVSGNTAANYTPFNPQHIRMRPSAPCGGEASVRWSTVKTQAWSDTVWATPSSSNYTNNWEWDVVCLTNSLKLLDRYGSNDPRLNNVAVNRWEGWFFVPFEKAGTWRMRLNYGDRMRLYIDGADTGAESTSSTKTSTADVSLAAGWHRYEICTFDSSGAAGPWSGSGIPALSYAVKTASDADFGPYETFNEDNLALSLAPDGYMQGEIALASGARVTNVSATPALVYADISADGATGAVMSGKFACVSNTVDFGTVAADTGDLTSVLRFDNAATNLFADVGTIAVNFAAKPTRGTILVGPAGGLEALAESELAKRVAVTVGGVPADEAKCVVLPHVEDGKLRLRFASGTIVIFR